MQRYKSAALIVAIGVLLAACGNSTPSSSKQLTVGFVTHVIGNPFVQSIASAAKYAGKDLGVTVKVTWPAGFDPVAQLTMHQAIASAGTDGTSTSLPGD